MSGIKNNTVPYDYDHLFQRILTDLHHIFVMMVKHLFGEFHYLLLK